jgi:hypothetical protein
LLPGCKHLPILLSPSWEYSTSNISDGYGTTHKIYTLVSPPPIFFYCKFFQIIIPWFVFLGVMLIWLEQTQENGSSEPSSCYSFVLWRALVSKLHHHLLGSNGNFGTHTKEIMFWTKGYLNWQLKQIGNQIPRCKIDYLVFGKLQHKIWYPSIR